MAKTVADQLAETLAAAGVKRIYGIVGDSLNGLTDAMRRQGKIEWVHVRHEEVAGCLFRLDAGRPDHLAPFLGFDGNEFSKVGGRAGKHGAAPGGYSGAEGKRHQEAHARYRASNAASEAALGGRPKTGR